MNKKEIYFKLCDEFLDSMDRSDIVVMAMEKYANVILEDKMPNDDEVEDALADYHAMISMKSSNEIDNAFLDGIIWLQSKLLKDV